MLQLHSLRPLTAGADTADDAVPPGTTYNYTWHVPETSGPGPEDPSTILWMYHSHTSECMCCVMRVLQAKRQLGWQYLALPS